METIKIYSLSEMSTRSESKKITKNQFFIYRQIRDGGKIGTHSMYFHENCEFAKRNMLYMCFAENNITGEKFLVFSKDSKLGGVMLNFSISRGRRYVTQKNAIVGFLLSKLNYEEKTRVSEVYNLSENLSLSEDIITLKILDKQL